MKTVILPGFSSANREWALSVRETLKLSFPVSVQQWEHWTSSKKSADWIKNEAYRFIAENQDEVNILAKSIGTAVAVTVLRLKPEIVNKIIFCGLPVNDFHPGDEKMYISLHSFPAVNFVCFQNKKDHHGSGTQAKSFLYPINPRLKIVLKSRSDHEYPYSEDFRRFLKS